MIKPRSMSLKFDVKRLGWLYSDKDEIIELRLGDFLTLYFTFSKEKINF